MSISSAPSPLPQFSDRLGAFLDRHAAILVTVLIILAAQWRLVIGQGVVGGDPDRMYIPFKAELHRAYAAGRLPHWSPHFGLGVPLLAESHIAALYPPNWLMFRWCDAVPGYHTNLLVHYVFMAVGTFVYVRTLGGSRWGAALAAVSFGLCGFLAIHASHEPFTLALAWMPWALAITERFARGGSWLWAIALAVVLAVQLLVGHFQMQFFTIGLVIIVGGWRIVQQGASRTAALARVLGLCVAAALAGGLAAPQLLPTGEMVREVGWTERDPAALASYMYPIWHLPELVHARLYELPEGPDSFYWHRLRTTGYESHLYWGIVPLVLVLASAALVTRCKQARPWLLIGVVTLLWSFGETAWGDNFLLLLRLPGVGYFRAPARYTVVTSFAVAVLAGLALTHLRHARAPRIAAALVALVAVLLSASLAAGFADAWYRTGLEPSARLARIELSTLAVILAAAGVWLWRRTSWAEPALVVLTGLEMAVFFNLAPLLRGRPSRLPDESPVLAYLTEHDGLGRVAGLDGEQNVPARVGLMSTDAYLGVEFPGLATERRYLRIGIAEQGRWIDPGGALSSLLAVRYLVWDGDLTAPDFAEAWRGPDPCLDRILRHKNAYAPPPAPGTWRIYERRAAVDWARLVGEVRAVPGPNAVLGLLFSGSVDPTSTALVWDSEQVPPGRADRAARVESLDLEPCRVTVRAEHHGPAYLLISQQMYPGWRARVDGMDMPIYRAYGCLQLVPMPGAGRSTVELRFEPDAFRHGLAVCVTTAIGMCLMAGILVAGPALRRKLYGTPRA